jgi:hypothetical protein
MKKIMNLKEKLKELKSQFLEEIENGNFELSNVTKESFLISVDGFKQIMLNIDEKWFFSSVGNETALFLETAPMPSSLAERLKEELFLIRELRMRELMNEYATLAKFNDEP